MPLDILLIVQDGEHRAEAVQGGVLPKERGWIAGAQGACRQDGFAGKHDQRPDKFHFAMPASLSSFFRIKGSVIRERRGGRIEHPSFDDEYVEKRASFFLKEDR